MELHSRQLVKVAHRSEASGSLAARRGRSQYGLLHFGQTRGAFSLSGIHSWPHRSQRHPSTVMVILAMLHYTA
jgi:hypothetical protein